MIIFASIGSSGNSAMRRPSLVSSPRSLRAPKAYSCSRALSKVSVGGGSMKSKPMRSLMPKLLSISTTLPAYQLPLRGLKSQSDCREMLQSSQDSGRRLLQHMNGDSVNKISHGTRLAAILGPGQRIVRSNGRCTVTDNCQILPYCMGLHDLFLIGARNFLTSSWDVRQPGATFSELPALLGLQQALKLRFA